MRTITDKIVQVHEECVCGHNIVYQTYFPVRWRDLISSGIHRRKDRRTGKYFLLKNIAVAECPGGHYEEDYEEDEL
ncbi:MAG: hypothetical protein LBL13_11930 [Bacteroidales bacterium]|jgi:hypothetical protein|nr:hypothetical protein [Bacteroidales bacterium]